MSVTYTRLLWSAPSLPGGLSTGPVVPAGQLWVVRSIVLHLPDHLPGRYIGTALLVDSSGVPIGGVGGADSCSQRVFSDDELRQVLTEGDSLSLLTDTAHWYVRVSGFVFSAP